MPGRLGKLPASYLFRETFSAPGAHQLRIMTICPTDGDTGIVVHDPAQNRTYYNDNADHASFGEIKGSEKPDDFLDHVQQAYDKGVPQQ